MLEGVVRDGDYVFRIPKDPRRGMRVDGVVFGDEELLRLATLDRALEQVANVACLPGIVGAALAMPDIHWGYGFPIGGVAATDPAEGGVISPGGVGFDISCGVRLHVTALRFSEVAPKMDRVMDALAASIPKGVGSTGRIRTSRRDLREICEKGARWAVEQGFGRADDLERIEDGGALPGGDFSLVSERAIERGSNQPGTLGAGNHFLEVQEVVEIFDERTAEAFGLFKGQLVVMVHSGSRGFGHQVCTDFLKVMEKASRRYGIDLPDRQLACAPVDSPEGRDYFAAMACAVNYALCNREVLGHWVRVSFEKALGASERSLGMDLLYDVSHNIAKFEWHEVAGARRRLCVHRKGATRAFGPGHPDLPERYRETGQPVIIPGDMGTSSYVLVGTNEAAKLSFSSTCHGAGRVMSRSEAKRKIRGAELKNELEARGIRVVSGSLALLAEEAPDAYKDVDRVVAVCEGAGLSRRVARLQPHGVVKG